MNCYKQLFIDALNDAALDLRKEFEGIPRQTYIKCDFFPGFKAEIYVNREGEKERIETIETEVQPNSPQSFYLAEGDLRSRTQKRINALNIEYRSLGDNVIAQSAYFKKFGT